MPALMTTAVQELGPELELEQLGPGPELATWIQRTRHRVAWVDPEGLKRPNGAHLGRCRAWRATVFGPAFGSRVPRARIRRGRGTSRAPRKMCRSHRSDLDVHIQNSERKAPAQAHAVAKSCEIAGWGRSVLDRLDSGLPELLERHDQMEWPILEQSEATTDVELLRRFRQRIDDEGLDPGASGDGE